LSRAKHKHKRTLEGWAEPALKLGTTQRSSIQLLATDFALIARKRVEIRIPIDSRTFAGRKSELAPADELALAALPKVFSAL
jgi:hypothetical protein